MKILYLVFLAFSQAFPTLEPIESGTLGPLDYCGGDSSIFNVETVEITPFPPKIGQNLTITASGTLRKPILQNSTLQLGGKWGAVPLFKQVHDFCEKTGNYGIPCPIMPGPFAFDYTQFLPANLPSITISLSVNLLDSEKKLITCLSGNVQLQS